MPSNFTFLIQLGAILLASQKNCCAYCPKRVPLRIPSSRHLQSQTTSNDVIMEQWYKQNGIIHPNIQLETTTRSIGGRGLFWKNTFHFASQGDILAFIPKELIFEPMNIKSNCNSKFVSELEETTTFSTEKHESNLSWATIFSLYAYKAFQDENDNIWKEWITLWKGGGPEGPKPFEKYTKEEVNRLQFEIENSNEEVLSTDDVKEVIDKRYNTYQRDFKSASKYNIEEELFSSLYSIVLSRTASLGSMWQNKRGIIPLHDMMNHPPKDGSLSKNVELFCVGDVRNMIGDEGFDMLFSKLIKFSDDVEYGSISYSDQDVLLVASKEIRYDDELFLAYRNCDQKVDMKQQIWLLLQYGFSFW